MSCPVSGPIRCSDHENQAGNPVSQTTNLTAHDFERSLGGKVLKDVSRSFFMTLRVLPNEVRGVCSLGYLLARTSDTLADTANVELVQRKALLKRYCEILRLPEVPREDLKAFDDQIQTDFLPVVEDRGERKLLQKATDVLEWLAALTPEYRTPVDRVMNAITDGQLADLEMFGESEPGAMRFLSSGVELTNYANQVAGSVGRFWTELGSLAFDHFADVSFESMASSGEAYGRGLQYINIIRDLGEDVKNGRCYLPLDELEYAGWEDGPWNTNQGALMNVSVNWLNHAEEGLREGLCYSQRLVNRRMKLATVMPAMIGAATIRMLRKSQSSFLTRKLKIDRAEARRISVGVTQRVLFSQKLEPYFHQLLTSD